MLPAISNEVQLEAYRDLLQGPMRRFGGALDKMAQLIVELPSKTKVPVQERLQLYEQERDRLQAELVSEAIARVSPNHRIFPAPQVAGPILENSVYEPKNTPIYEMWRELLSRACDQSLAKCAHPAFPGIISQLSNDEAKLLIFFRGFLWPWRPDSFDDTHPYSERVRSERTEACRGMLDFPDNLHMYLEHVIALGIIEKLSGGPPLGTPVFHLLTIRELPSHLHFTAFGETFMSAVNNGQSDA